MFEPIPGDRVFRVVPGGSDVVVAVAIARSGLDSRVVYLTCGLALCAAETPPFWEFYFQIDVLPVDGDQEDFTTQDREIAVPYIPAQVRPEMVPLVIAGLEKLLRDVNPEAIFFVTKETNLPDKALVKFRALEQAAGNNGYFTHAQGTDLLGRCYWKMGKMPVEPHIGVA